MRILHLAYEDPKQPGSGGGSIRTLEINRRLAKRHDVTAVVSGYRGAVERIEDNIRWIPIGTSFHYLANKLSYFALLGLTIRKYEFDLLVEDFGAPFSVGFSPLFTNKPVVASVQWLFASQMREKYHLPFEWVEQYGLRYYKDFITVSEWLADVIRQRGTPDTVEAIPNGIEDIAFTTAPRAPDSFVFVGRLDIAQKGCDLLIKSLAKAKAILGDELPTLNIIGDGPDENIIRSQVAEAGLSDSVVFCGRKVGIEKYEMMASAYAVLMPSRFETFGMVAVEAQATSAPIIAYDVGPLREVAGEGGAYLIPPFDTQSFAEAMIDIVQKPQKLSALRQQGREWARRYNWDVIAEQQENYYLSTLERRRIE